MQHWVLGALNLFIMPPSPHVLAASRSGAVRFARVVAGWLRPVMPLGLLIAQRERWAKLVWSDKCGIVDSFGMYGIQFGPETPIAADLLVPPVPARLDDVAVWMPRDAEQYLGSLFGDFRQLPPLSERRPGHITAVGFGQLPQ